MSGRLVRAVEWVSPAEKASGEAPGAGVENPRSGTDRMEGRTTDDKGSVYKVQALSAGADVHFTKPVPMDELIAAINRHLG
jgi:hypothetical protein